MEFELLVVLLFKVYLGTGQLLVELFAVGLVALQEVLHLVEPCEKNFPAGGFVQQL